MKTNHSRRSPLFLLLLGACLCMAAASCVSGPVSGQVLAGAAAVIAVFDQMLAAGTIDPAQHAALVHGMGGMQAAVDAVQESQRGALSPETAAAGAGGLAAAILTAIRVWRGPSSKTKVKAA